MIKGKVLNSAIDQNGNILVKTEYTLTTGAKVIGHTRYNFLNFSKAQVLQDVKAHCETLMSRTYSLKAHQELIKEDITDIQHECISLEVTKADGTKIIIDDK